MRILTLSIGKKLSLTILLTLVPLVVLLYFFLESRDERILAAQGERNGLAYLADLRLLLDSLNTHRDATQGVLAGDASFQQPLEASKPHIAAALISIDRIDAATGAKWETTGKWQTIKNNWLALQGATFNEAESFRRHSELTSAVIQLMRAVSDRSGLTTDSAIDTYYLVDSLINGVTPAIDELSRLRGNGNAAFARGSATIEDAANIAALVRALNENNQGIERALSGLERNNPDIAAGLGDTWKSAQKLSDELTRSLQRDIQPGRTFAPGAAKAFHERASRALAEYFILYDNGRITIETLLTRRVDSLAQQKLVQSTIVLLVFLIAAWLVISIVRGVTKQTRAISKLFGQIRAGNLEARAHIYCRDELGLIAEELNLMLDDTLQLVESKEEKERIQSSIVKLLGEVSGVATGDLTRDAEVTADVTGAIADAFNYMLIELRQIISSVQSTTIEVTTSAAEVQQTASQLAYGSSTQSTAIAHASSAIADMALSIQNVSHSALQAAEIADRALRDAKGGSETVGKTIDGMNAIRSRVQETSKRIKRLGESSQEIGEIVRLIVDIADRTSILALNASIQASAAGEAGKGFAVVAEEVERLAVRAAESAKKIAMIIKSVQGDTTEAVAAMEETTREVVNGSRLANEAGQRLRDLEDVSHQIADLVAGISAASRQQAAGSEQVAKNVEGISQFTRQTANGAQVTEESTRRLVDLAAELNSSISRFRLPADYSGPIPPHSVRHGS
ncbi:hypothetical protein F183_A36180 [Bryobacterales bacterium F-183]|nr:hypothetical protein F183_A36180 [Bryobacterales bacterium F-183]